MWLLGGGSSGGGAKEFTRTWRSLVARQRVLLYSRSIPLLRRFTCREIRLARFAVACSLNVPSLRRRVGAGRLCNYSLELAASACLLHPSSSAESRRAAAAAAAARGDSVGVVRALMFRTVSFEGVLIGALFGVAARARGDDGAGRAAAAAGAVACVQQQT